MFLPKIKVTRTVYPRPGSPTRSSMTRKETEDARNENKRTNTIIALMILAVQRIPRKSRLLSKNLPLK
jgi:hypothetical protein